MASAGQKTVERAEPGMVEHCSPYSTHLLPRSPESPTSQATTMIGRSENRPTTADTVMK
ncbi:hypothetical protein AB0D11_16340 [Streptomyces monashensis]|uniref:hypothetical protein n=1 Tax=Streptomyces monashensis TaxID=1678012 RepID=UPI00340B2672